VVKTWAQTVAQGLLQSWLFFDPMVIPRKSNPQRPSQPRLVLTSGLSVQVIITRNNAKALKKRIRSKRYQMMEKAIVSPIVAFMKFIAKAFSGGG
jgi:hypothetical protein